MFKLIKSYLWECISLSFRSSWAATTGLFGTILGGLSVTFLGSIHFVGNGSQYGQAINGAITTAIYALLAWVIICILRIIFVSPFQIWKEQEARIAALEAEKETSAIRIREVELQEALVVAIRAQTEEHRLQRAQREKENDPLIKAFFERRIEQYKIGETFEEQTLNYVIFWIADHSAWSRWQDAFSLRHNGQTVGEFQKMHMATSALQIAAETGELLICGRQSGQIAMEPISPDFWRNVAALGVQSDLRAIWKVYVLRRSFGSEEPVELPTYNLLQSDMKRVRELWPENDPDIDAKTDRLLAEHSNNG